MRCRVLLLGEANPYGADPAFALYPLPRGASGDRLRVILNLSTTTYLRIFDRRNLLEEGRWSAPRARDEVGNIRHRRRVLLGEKVTRAHGVAFAPFTSGKAGAVNYVILPHPSGRSRAWNDPDAPLLARAAVRRFFLECGLQPRPEWEGT